METKKELKIDLSPKELLILSNLFFNLDFPHCHLTLEQVSNILDCSKATSITILKNLEKKGLITKVKGFVNFYYPVKDGNVRQLILCKLGIKSK